MIVIHAVKKLQNASRLSAPLMISNPDSGQMLFEWYASLISTGFPGKLMTIYVHNPSLMTVICKSRTLQTGWKDFRPRLDSLLVRHNFTKDFIQTEMALMEDYIVSKTDSRSMLSHINQMTFYLEALCENYGNYAEISNDFLEDAMIDYMHQSGRKSSQYTTPLAYWKNKGAVTSNI